MNFKVDKKDVPVILQEFIQFKEKVSSMTKKINYLYELPNICIEWVHRKGFVSLGLYGNIVEINSELYSCDIGKGTLQSFSKYQDVFRKEYYRVKELYEKK